MAAYRAGAWHMWCVCVLVVAIDGKATLDQVHTRTCLYNSFVQCHENIFITCMLFNNKTYEIYVYGTVY
jgi:hypothetical protein